MSRKVQNRSLTSSYKAISLGSNFLAGIGFGAFGGYKLDQHFENKNYVLTIVGILLGFSWGMYETFKLVAWQNRIEEQLEEDVDKND